MKAYGVLLACIVGLLVSIGCSGKGDILPLKLAAMPPEAKKKMTKAVETLKVAVKPFRDTRQIGNRLGTRDSFWGSTDTFSVAGGQTGQTAAKLMVDYLTQHGWNVALADANSPNSDSDVILSGEIKRLTVDAKGGWFSSDITAASKVIVEGLNVKDGSVVRMTLSGAGSEGVFWFSSDDAEELVNGVLKESFAKLVSSTKVEEGTLRLN